MAAPLLHGIGWQMLADGDPGQTCLVFLFGDILCVVDDGPVIAKPDADVVQCDSPDEAQARALVVTAEVEARGYDLAVEPTAVSVVGRVALGNRAALRSALAQAASARM